MDGSKVYVDSSVVVRRILRQPGAIAHPGNWEVAVTSELTELEAGRALDRVRLSGAASAAEIAGCVEDLRVFTDGCEVVPLQTKILRRAARPLPTWLGSLDAIHLATALLRMEDNDEELTLLTHDQQLAACARACGVLTMPQTRR